VDINVALRTILTTILRTLFILSGENITTFLRRGALLLLLLLLLLLILFLLLLLLHLQVAGSLRGASVYHWTIDRFSVST
jgi:hypothetical protein